MVEWYYCQFVVVVCIDVGLCVGFDDVEVGVLLEYCCIVVVVGIGQCIVFYLYLVWVVGDVCFVGVFRYVCY